MDESALENIHLREYLRIARKHAWLVVACVLAVVAIAGVATYLQRPVYRASTKALVEREGTRVVNFQEAGPVQMEFSEFLQTEIQVIRSRPVVQRVIETLGLAGRKPELAKTKDPSEEFLQQVRIEPVRNTHIVEIQVEDTDPQLAADIANALASAYVHQNLEMKLNSARDALGWLTNQVSDLKTKVNESELALQRYREQAGLIAVEEKQSLSSKKLGEFNSAYIDAKAKRLEMEARMVELRKASSQPEALESSPLVINNPVVQRLKGQLVELEVQKSKLLKTFKEKHPEVLKVQSQIDEVSVKIREEVSRLVQSMESEYNAVKARENAMIGAVNQYRDEAQSMSKKEIQYGILKREADSNQQLYDVLLKRLKETGLSQGLDTNNIRIMETAVAPAFPVRPRKAMNMALALGIGLALGLGIAFLAEYMDDTVRTPEQVENALGLPVFSLIPLIPARSRS